MAKMDQRNIFLCYDQEKNETLGEHQSLNIYALAMVKYW